MQIDKNKALVKWKPILQRLDINNEYLIECVSIYCELFSYEKSQSNQTNVNSGLLNSGYWSSVGNQQINGSDLGLTELPAKLKEIKIKLSEIFKPIEVTSYWLDPISNKLKYKTTNGEIHDKFDKLEITEQQFIYLFDDFGIEVCKTFDINDFREMRINNTLDNGKS